MGVRRPRARLILLPPHSTRRSTAMGRILENTLLLVKHLVSNIRSHPRDTGCLDISSLYIFLPLPFQGPMVRGVLHYRSCKKKEELRMHGVCPKRPTEEEQGHARNTQIPRLRSSPSPRQKLKQNKTGTRQHEKGEIGTATSGAERL